MTPEISDDVLLVDGTLGSRNKARLENLITEGIGVAQINTGEISAVTAFIDENQRLEGDRLKVSVGIQPVGHTNFIDLDLGFEGGTTV